MQNCPNNHSDLFKALYLVKGDNNKRKEFRDMFVKLYGYKFDIGIGIVARNWNNETIFYLCDKKQYKYLEHWGVWTNFDHLNEILLDKRPIRLTANSMDNITENLNNQPFAILKF
jgi:hypothetical protein